MPFLNTISLGNPENLPMLFLHGFMGSAQDWQKMMQHFADRYFCIALDAPGHGKTDFQANEQYFSVPGFAEQIISLLHSQKLRSVILMGYSMGGRVAFYLSQYFPQYFKTAIFESVSPGLQTERERSQRIDSDAKLAHRILSEDFSEFLQQWYEQPIFGDLKNHPRFPQLLQRRLQNSREGLADSLKFMGTGAQPSLWETIKLNKLPLLLLTGEFDVKFQTVAQEIIADCPSSLHKIIPGAAHNCHFENETAFIQIVEKFLAEIEEA